MRIAPVVFALCIAAPLLCGAELRSTLANPGFEDADPLAGWPSAIYGAQPKFAADTAEKREGSQSLRIESAEPSDTAIAQDLALPAGKVFRLTGWLKTRELRMAEDHGMGATLQIQCANGRVFSSRSLLGTNDWTRETVLFRVPPDGRVHVALFFFGFGKGTGTAWLDGISIEEAQSAGSNRLKIGRERLSDAPVSPFQIGQFVEVLCDLIPSMHAERLDHGSFEVFPPFKVSFRPEVDRRDRPWYPTGAVHRGEYTYDTEQPFNGARSLRIRVAAGEPCTLGMSQDGIFVEKGKRYHLRLHMRADREGIAPRARLHGGGRELARAELGATRTAWTKHDGDLLAAETCLDATLAIEFRAPGTLWLDRVSLVPADACPGGWRPDVVAALRELKPGIIRFGGSTLLEYEWEKSIGDADYRVPFTTCWGGLEPNYVGIEEFITLCRLVDAEPLICLRWHGKKPEDAAAQVEYVNGPPDSPGGQRRARNGHPEPYGVKYWQIGNEVGGAEYEASIRAFALAMKRADPSIKIQSSFPSEGVMRAAGDLLDYLCPHHYGCANLEAMEEDVRNLADLIKRHGGGRPIRIAVTEWNTTAGDWALGRASLLTLDNALACARYHNLMQRHASLIEIAIRSNLCDSFCSGIIQTSPHGLYLAPTYGAQKLYARASGFFPVKIETALPAALDEIDASALIAPDGKTLLLYAVNSERSDHRRTIDLKAFAPVATTVGVTVLGDRDRAGERDIMNDFDDPGRVVPVASTISIAQPEFEYIFPGLSITLLEFRVGD
jgi:alpha-L-arabinofuranosidase